jgi:hypothetical protein
VSAGRAAAGLAAAAAVLAAPEVALACAVCTGNDPLAVSRAMLKGTVLLSLLPLALIGGVVLYLRRRARALRDTPRP